MKMKLFKQIEILLHFQANFSENNLWYQFICPQYSKITVILRISSFTDSKKKTKSFLDKNGLGGHGLQWGQKDAVCVS